MKFSSNKDIEMVAIDKFLPEGVSEVPIELLQQFVAPDSEVRLYRNIPYRVDDDERPDIIFAVSVILRFDANYWKSLEEEPEVYLENLKTIYQYLQERIGLWFAVACDIYDGFMEPEEGDERLRVTEIPARLGESTISVYGTMVDPKGRSVTVTLTENTTPETLYGKAVTGLELYESITTTLAGGEDMNNFNSGGFFQAYTKLDKKGSSKKKEASTPRRQRFTKDGNTNNDDNAGQSNTGAVVNRHVRKSDSTPKAPTKRINTIEELRSEVEIEGKFSIPVGVIANSEDTYDFYVYTEETTAGTRELETEDRIFFFKNRDDSWFQKFEQQMNSLGVVPDVGEQLVVRDIVVIAKKRLSKNNNIWYSPIAVIQADPEPAE